MTCLNLKLINAISYSEENTIFESKEKMNKTNEENLSIIIEYIFVILVTEVPSKKRLNK